MRSPLLLTCLLTLLTLPALADNHDREGRHRYRQVPPNASYRAECASCHMAYPPGMLPAASWRRVMGGLDRHFGENASLDAATRDDITAFLVLWSAENTNPKYRRKYAENPASPPLRITSTVWFRHKHDEIRPDVFRRKGVGSAANCVACHRQAEHGDFDDDSVRIPPR